MANSQRFSSSLEAQIQPFSFDWNNLISLSIKERLHKYFDVAQDPLSNKASLSTGHTQSPFSRKERLALFHGSFNFQNKICWSNLIEGFAK